MTKADQKTKRGETKSSDLNKPIVDLSNILVRYPPDGIQSVYGNIVLVNWTLHDVRIRFSELMYTTDPANPTTVNQIGVIEERVGVTIPWTQAKLLRDNLNTAIAAYEKVNGELTQPKLALVD
jgi:Protein of unknown function (DUF3467)